MKNVVNNDKKIMKEMDQKLNIMIDLVHKEANSELIFYNKEGFLNFINLLKEVYDLWDDISNHTDDLLEIHRTLLETQEIVEINEKHYGGPINL